MTTTQAKGQYRHREQRSLSQKGPTFVIKKSYREEPGIGERHSSRSKDFDALDHNERERREIQDRRTPLTTNERLTKNSDRRYVNIGSLSLSFDWFLVLSVSSLYWVSGEVIKMGFLFVFFVIRDSLTPSFHFGQGNGKCKTRQKAKHSSSFHFNSLHQPFLYPPFLLQTD